MDLNNIGKVMYERATELFPINRSLSGPGVRQTLTYLKDIIPELNIHSVSSGTQAFDWTVPREWHIEDAYIIAPNGEKCNFGGNVTFWIIWAPGGAPNSLRSPLLLAPGAS